MFTLFSVALAASYDSVAGDTTSFDVLSADGFECALQAPHVRRCEATFGPGIVAEDFPFAMTVTYTLRGDDLSALFVKKAEFVIHTAFMSNPDCASGDGVMVARKMKIAMVDEPRAGPLTP